VFVIKRTDEYQPVILNSGIFDIAKFGQLFKEKGRFGKEVQGPKIVLYNRPALSLNTLLKGSKKVRT